MDKQERGTLAYLVPLHFKKRGLRSKWMYLSPKIFPTCHPWSVNYMYHTNEILMIKILNYTFFFYTTNN